MLNLNQIKAQVSAVRKSYPDAQSIGIHSESRWGEKVEQQVDGRRVIVSQCDSPLAIRLALREGGSDDIRVLVTPLSDNDLSDDILLRLKPRRLLTLDNWQIVKSMFQAKTIDPRLSQLTWLPDMVMTIQDSEEFPAAPGGFLDAETVWPILLRHFLRFTGERPDLLSVLEWSMNADGIRQYKSMPQEIQSAVKEWMESQSGQDVSLILETISDLPNPDCVPLALAMAVFGDDQHASSLALARGKLEGGYLKNRTLNNETILNWAAAATEIVTLRIDDPRKKTQVLTRSDEILREIGVKDFAWLSSTSIEGYEQRLRNFAQRLTEMVDSGFETSVDLLVECRNLVVNHHLSGSDKRRLERLDMALRLVRWAKGETQREISPDFAAATEQHLKEDGFVDWARHSLINTEAIGELSQAYTKLYRRCSEIREQHGRRFAELLVEFTKADSQSDGIVPVEKILESVVAPIAREQRVLVLVMDGMSVSDFRELMVDVLERDWILASPEEQGLLAGLAVIPSQTEVSRASLLSGQLINCHADNEKKNFATHSALNDVSRSGYPPVLFHKRELHKPDDEELHSEVRKEISNSHRKVVGVVVNAIDDHLLKGDQLDVKWSRDEIRGLATLLHEARSNDRVVVMVSDHGHVLDFESIQPSKKDEKSGERWRLDDGSPQEGEMQIEGYRVTPPNYPDVKRIIAPWVEKIRYGMKKNGYHGGLAPQEMIIPIAVLTANDRFPKGWSECPVDSPDWWDIETMVRDERPFPSVRLRPSEEIKQPDPEPEPGLLFPIHLDEKESEADPGAEEEKELPGKVEWVEALLRSAIYSEQKSSAGRAVPTDDSMRRLLTALHNAGGKLTSTALARTLSLSPMRLRSTLAITQRILNVEGFGVLVRDDASDSVELNLGMLLSQFDLQEE